MRSSSWHPRSSSSLSSQVTYSSSEVPSPQSQLVSTTQSASRPKTQLQSSASSLPSSMPSHLFAQNFAFSSSTTLS